MGDFEKVLAPLNCETLDIQQPGLASVLGCCERGPLATPQQTEGTQAEQGSCQVSDLFQGGASCGSASPPPSTPPELILL